MTSIHQANRSKFENENQWDLAEVDACQTLRCLVVCVVFPWAGLLAKTLFEQASQSCSPSFSTRKMKEARGKANNSTWRRAAYEGLLPPQQSFSEGFGWPRRRGHESRDGQTNICCNYNCCYFYCRDTMFLVDWWYSALASLGGWQRES
jgi:hypothetical protein